ncbi:MAG: carotenoid oxygenase family protein [Hyphomonadaceae bacterium]
MTADTAPTGLSRRNLLAGGAALTAGLALAPQILAEPAPASWTLGWTTAPAAGFDPAPMKLIAGKAPKGLAGTLYRNGPGQLRYGETYLSHWFDGDGMIQRLAIEDGKAIHTGRFVQTPKRKAEQAAGKFLAPGFGSLGDKSYPVANSDDVNAANTSVIMSGGELLALWEAGSAWGVDPATLETRKPKVWRDDLKGMPFLAHPKREPDGRLWNLAVSGAHVGIYRISPAGELEDFQMVNVGAPAYIHDWTMTERKLIILVQPWLMTRQIPPFVDSLAWKPGEGLKIMILDKDDLSKVRWAEAPPRAFYHTGAAWEDSDGTVRLDAVFYREPILGSGGGQSEMRGEYKSGEQATGYLSMLTIPASGGVKLEETEIEGEFPQVDPRRHGLRRKLTLLAAGSAPNRPGNTSVAVRDWDSGKTHAYDFGADYLVEEFLIAPKPRGSKETDAWLIGVTLNTKARASELHVFDAASVEGGPVASWRAGYAWPLGFHGAWSA